MGMALLSTCGARSRLVIKPPEKIDSSQAPRANEPWSCRRATEVIGIARRCDPEDSDS
jgi:hypothetical protein